MLYCRVRMSACESARPAARATSARRYPRSFTSRSRWQACGARRIARCAARAITRSGNTPREQTSLSGVLTGGFGASGQLIVQALVILQSFRNRRD